MMFLIFLLLIALTFNLIGFVKTVWFISLGYTICIVVFALVTIGLLHASLTLASTVHLLGMLVWGVRLGWFLFRREAKASYRAATQDQTRQSQSLSLLLKTAIWVAVSLLYVAMFSPVAFGAMNDADKSNVAHSVTVVGLLFMWAGLILESVADHQKSVFKSVHPQALVRTGLYGWVRYPNYLGEIVFWTGSFVAGTFAFSEWWQWVIASVGLVCIVLIMIGSAKRLELKHEERYAGDSEFGDYVGNVPVMLPFIPLYTLKKVRVYLG